MIRLQNWIPQEYQKDSFPRAMRELERLKDEPRLLVIMTQGLVELIVNTIVDKTCKDADQIKGEGRLILLHELKILSDHEYVILKWLRNLRNDSAHRPFFELTASRLELFDDEDLRDPANFSDLCALILMVLFANHQIVYPVLFESASVHQVQLQISADPDTFLPLKDSTKN